MTDLAPLPPTAAEHCGSRRRWRPGKGRSPAGPPSGPDCAVLVQDWGHPTPCVDCAGLAGPEDGVPGLAWLAAPYGWTWDAPEMMEAVTWQ